MPGAGAEGDEATFEGVVLPHRGALYRRALRLARSRDAASDLTQDTLERAFRRFQGFRKGSNVRGWMFKIMYHVFCDGRRRRRREVLDEDLPTLPDTAPDTTPRFDVIGAEALRSAVARLELGQREVVELRWAQRCSYQMISQQLGIPLGTVGTRLSRAYQRLRAVLDPQRASD
jgi:RNA polymerase sigma-70 factor (ECF subfamily)